MLNKLSPALRSRVAAYRDGVNAWISHVRTSPQDLPGEFAALGVQLTDWSEDDSIAPVRVAILITNPMTV